MGRKSKMITNTIILGSMLFTTMVAPVAASPVITAKSAVTAQTAAPSIAVSSNYLLLYLNKQEAFLNNEKIILDAPATVIKGSTFVPTRFLAETLDFPIHFDAETNTVHLQPDDADILVDLQNKTVIVNGMPVSYDEAVQMIKGRLMFKLTWIMGFIKAKYTYNQELNRVEVLFIKHPEGLLNEDGTNSRPVAKFAFGKTSYRLGGKIKYIDLSYDVDGDGIVSRKWTNHQDAFFKPGKYTVSLQVQDKQGNESAVYTRDLVIEDVSYMDELEFQIYNNPIAGNVKADRSLINQKFINIPLLKKTVTEDRSRPLIVSDSPERITQKGILYQEKVNGKARLYSYHQNAMNEKLQYVILAENQTEKPITIKTVRKGEVFPSLYMNLIGHQAIVDFLLNESNQSDVVIPPFTSQVYVQFPYFSQGEGVNMIYDVETDGELTFSFIATDMADPIAAPNAYLPLSYVNNVRGTFPVSQVNWNIDGAQITEISKITIGDGSYDKYVAGYDNERKLDVVNKGNYGVEYHLHINHPQKMAILVLSRGGVFKGPFKVDDDFVMIPRTGVVTAFDGLQLLARTNGNESGLDIHFVPPGASAFPVDLIFYPLKSL